MYKTFIIHLFLFLTLLSGSNDLKSHNQQVVYQVGTIGSLLAGVYEGDVSMNDLSNFGDFGLGTFDGANGEMIAFNNNFYRADAHGNANIVQNMHTPFAVVTNFSATNQYKLEEFENLNSLHGFIKTKFDSDNLIYAVLIEGNFSSVYLRSEYPQLEGHKPLLQTISQVQQEFRFENTKGTIVGFWFPKYMSNLNVAGFHFHFLNDKTSHGGHMIDMKLKSGVLKIMPIYDFKMHLIDTNRFRKTNLDKDFKSAAKKVEHR
jgi:acetolactate decarboxylase